MTNAWERFDNIAQPDDVLEAKAQFDPIEAGTYKMTLEEIEPTTTKESGLPMLSAKFRLIDTNRILFYNQVMQNVNYPKMTAVNIAEALGLVSGLVEEDLDFEGMSQFAKTVTDIPIGTQHLITITYGAKDTEKNFPKLRVVKDTDDMEIEDNELDDDVPF